MDIFNKKRIKDLETEVKRLRDVESEKNELKHMLNNVERELKTVLKLKEYIPEDCIPGIYCEACEFAKRYRYENWGFFNNRATLFSGTICGKAESCKNFVQREIKE